MLDLAEQRRARREQREHDDWKRARDEALLQGLERRYRVTRAFAERVVKAGAVERVVEAAERSSDPCSTFLAVGYRFARDAERREGRR